jgi:molybdopterin synthase catalytic subunit
MGIVVRLEERELAPERELSALVAEAAGAGAAVSFVGLARAESACGEAVSRLVLEYHPRLTLRSIEKIAGDAAQRFDVSHVRVVHRCGAIAPGGPIVFAAAASRHRRAAFEAADYLMDRLKSEALFWKREDGDGASRWIEPTEADYADRRRWES